MQQFANVNNGYSWVRGFRPITNNYYCTAVRPQLNTLILQQFVHSAYKPLQSANVQAEISLHSYTIRKQAPIKH